MLYFIVNEKSRSGKGAEVWQEIRRELEQQKVSYQAWNTEYEGHAMLLAEQICEMEDEDICLVVVGGDGTANEVLNGMTHFEKVRFGLIPTGSGNDFARGLGISGSPVETLNDILDKVKAGNSRYKKMDLGQVSWDGCKKPRKFAISAGVGLDAIVCKKALHSTLKDFLNKIHLGKLTYILLTIQTLFDMKTEDIKGKYDEAGIRNQKKTIFAAAMNFRAEGGGVPMAPSASAQDGKLSVCTAYGIPKWRTFFCLPFLMAAKHERIKGFDVTDCKTCSMHISGPMVLHADGEYCGDVTEVVFECLPGKLHILR